MATINEIAAKLGISKSTVSRVINNDPNVKEKTRESVWRVIRELDYKPNIIARGMITGSLPLVLVIVGDIQNHYFAKTIIGIEKVLTEKDYMPVIYNSMYDVEKEKRLIRMAKDCQFAGIIPMTGVRSNELEECLRDVDCPVVLINRELKKLELDEIYGDDVEASYKATQELIDNGHRVIAHLSGSSTSTVSAKRRLGYCMALEDNGIPVDEALIFEGKLDMASGYALGEKLFAHSNITAVCSNNFLMALGVVRYAKSIGKTVLKDFDIACCETVPDLYEESAYVYAGADLEEIGKKATEILLKRIEKSEEPRQKICFPATQVYNPKKEIES